MTSIIIAGRPNSEETSECIIVAENIANLYPSSRFTIVLKSPSEWENYCEDICNLFGILKKTHPLIMFSNGTQIKNIFVGQKDYIFLIKFQMLLKKFQSNIMILFIINIILLNQIMKKKILMI